ncbi:MAG: FGGY family carbohydrate kinase [Gaiellaceae bacterium]
MILALDQGTTGTTCLVVDDELRVQGRGYRQIQQYYPRPGWVEHDPEELWTSALEAAELALADAGIRARQLTALGLANQRETTLLWERASGRPVQRAIVWQDRRTAERCRSLPAALIRERTGLVPDPYFSATKLEWLLEHAAPDRRPGELAFGTVDSWLAWKLTGGRVHVTDVSNAARTLLLDLRRLEWDEELLRLFGVPRELLPELRPSSGLVAEVDLLGATMPLAALAGDQQAALFGQACHRRGQAKATYGTGSFVLVHAGTEPAPAPAGVLLTAACKLGGRPADYAYEGSIFVAGAALQWLRDLGLIGDAGESEALADSVEDSLGVHFVPAFVGLGSPHWAPESRGLVSGLTRGVGRAHLVRAALEAAAFQVRDVFEAISLPLSVLRADGGMSRNGFAMQFQADLLGVPVEVAAETEATALGAAALAGLASGRFGSPEEVAARWRAGTRFEPRMGRDQADSLYDGWQRAVRLALAP